MNEFLTADRHDASRYYDNPYTEDGAREIVRRFRDDVIEMLDEMDLKRRSFQDGKTMLSRSPLKSKPYVAAAMKTLGLVEERPTPNGTCALVLTPKAIAQMENLTR